MRNATTTAREKKADYHKTTLDFSHATSASSFHQKEKAISNNILLAVNKTKKNEERRLIN